MALLADGWHMSTHVAALGITAGAYLTASGSPGPFERKTPSGRSAVMSTAAWWGISSYGPGAAATGLPPYPPHDRGFLELDYRVDG